jgi:ABC-2 type transport system ATP-binding protein
LAPFKLIRVTLRGNRENDAALERVILNAAEGSEVVERDGASITLRVGRAEAPALTAHVLNTLPVADLSVEDPPIEAVIDQIYQDGAVDLASKVEPEVTA